MNSDKQVLQLEEFATIGHLLNEESNRRPDALLSGFAELISAFSSFEPDASRDYYMAFRDRCFTTEGAAKDSAKDLDRYEPNDLENKVMASSIAYCCGLLRHIIDAHDGGTIPRGSLLPTSCSDYDLEEVKRVMLGTARSEPLPLPVRVAQYLLPLAMHMDLLKRAEPVEEKYRLSLKWPDPSDQIPHISADLTTLNEEFALLNYIRASFSHNDFDKPVVHLAEKVVGRIRLFWASPPQHLDPRVSKPISKAIPTLNAQFSPPYQERTDFVEHPAYERALISAKDCHWFATAATALGSDIDPVKFESDKAMAKTALSKGIARLTHHLESEAADQRGFYLLSLLQDTAEDFENAIATILRTLEIEQDPFAHGRHAMLLARTGKFDQAIESAKLAAETPPALVSRWLESEASLEWRASCGRASEYGIKLHDLSLIDVAFEIEAAGNPRRALEVMNLVAARNDNLDGTAADFVKHLTNRIGTDKPVETTGSFAMGLVAGLACGLPGLAIIFLTSKSSDTRKGALVGFLVTTGLLVALQCFS